jgi:hypothetical protein
MLSVGMDCAPIVRRPFSKVKESLALRVRWQWASGAIWGAGCFWLSDGVEQGLEMV